MWTKVNITYTFISIILFYVSTTHAMLTRLSSLNHIKKVNLRKYSTHKDLKNLVAQQFVLKNPISPQKIDALLNYNRDKYYSLEDSYNLSLTSMIFTPIAILFSLDSGGELVLLPTIVLGVSVFSFARLSYPLNKRRNMIKILEHASNTRSLSYPNMMYVHQITQKDIRKNIKNLSIQPTKQDPSYLMHQPTKTTYTWNINNPEILKDTLEGKYNAANYTLYLSDKE